MRDFFTTCLGVVVAMLGALMALTALDELRDVRRARTRFQVSDLFEGWLAIGVVGILVGVVGVTIAVAA